jgi:signal transduction histidine kinase
MLRQLRGLRVQLLLWTIFPLAAVLVILSLAGITRHRQAMTQLVADRDRGLALAEANRLGREVDQRITSLVRAAGQPGLQGDLMAASAAAADLADRLGDNYSAVALLDGDRALLWSSWREAGWATDSAVHEVAAQVRGSGQPQFVEYLDPAGVPHLMVAAPVPPDRVLLGIFPVETLSLAESAGLVESETRGAAFVLDRAGRPIHHYNPGGLFVDEAALAHLPAISPDSAGNTYLRTAQNHELLVSYARIEPPGWTFVTAENVHAIASLGISVVEVLPMVLLFVAVVALLAVSFGVANIVRPLQELDRRAARVAWGDFDAVKRPVGGVQEMDDLRATLAQMAERIRAYQTGMRDYLSAITRAQEEERSRLAHELHDDTVQALIALKQRTQMARKALASSPGSGQPPDPERAARRLDELEKLIDQELAALRRLISDLRPIYLEDLGFVPALEMLAHQLEERYGLDVRLDVRGETVRLAPDLELAAFRIVQQALNNVATHAQARNASVTVVFASDDLTLTVQDDGRGFIPPDQPADLAREGHFGLMGMRERAMLYGGYLTIASTPGQGARITAWLPVR